MFFGPLCSSVSKYVPLYCKRAELGINRRENETFRKKKKILLSYPSSSVRVCPENLNPKGEGQVPAPALRAGKSPQIPSLSCAQEAVLINQTSTQAAKAQKTKLTGGVSIFQPPPGKKWKPSACGLRKACP